MYVIDNLNRDDACVNLAIEEYCLRNLDLDDEAVLIYVNRPSVIIGRHQNPAGECDLSYLERHQVPLIRRVSGGGTVYHDRGNLNYAFIKPHQRDSLADIPRHLAPIVKALQRFGLPVSVGDHNDLTVNGRKISGNAQFSNTRSLLIHGTLLVHSDLEALAQALTPVDCQIRSKSRPSIRSPVANVTDLLNRPLSMADMCSHLLNAVGDGVGRLVPWKLSDRDWLRIEQLADDKYRSWDWNFARSADFYMSRPIIFEGRRLIAHLYVHRWRVQSVEVKTQQGTPASGVEALIESWVGRPFQAARVGIPDQEPPRRSSANDGVSAAAIRDLNRQPC